MAQKRDYYEVLGVARGADKDEVKRAYRRLALEHHPDTHKAPDAEARFKEIGEAYAVLSDQEKRRLYDQFGHAGVAQRYSTEDIFRGADLGGFEDVFGRLFESFFGGPVGRAGHGPLGGRDIGLRVSVTLEEALRGVTKEFRVEHARACGACDGTGASPGSSVGTCPDCRGRGQVQHAQRTVFGSFVQVVTCHGCGGSGKRAEKPCRDCHGAGAVRSRDNVEVTIPPGIDDGDRLRLSGQGDVLVPGGRAGDLFLEIRVEENPRFRREGPHLLSTAHVDYPTLVLGGTIPVETLDGDGEVEVPAGSQPGQRLRLSGRGMPARGGRRGDLFLELRLDVPKKVGREEKELLERLRGLPPETGRGWFGRRKAKSDE